MSILVGKKMNWNHWPRISDLTRMKYTVMLVPGYLINSIASHVKSFPHQPEYSTDKLEKFLDKSSNNVNRNCKNYM